MHEVRKYVNNLFSKPYFCISPLVENQAPHNPPLFAYFYLTDQFSWFYVNQVIDLLAMRQTVKETVRR